MFLPIFGFMRMRLVVMFGDRSYPLNAPQYIDKSSAAIRIFAPRLFRLRIGIFVFLGGDCLDMGIILASRLFSYMSAISCSRAP